MTRSELDSLVPWQVLLQSSPDVHSVHDAAGRVLLVGGACEQLIGYAADELVGKDPDELVHPDDHELLRSQLRALSGGLSLVRVRLLHRDGHEVHVEAAVRDGRDDPALRCVLVSTRDVSERTQVEQVLRGSESRLRSLVERAPVGLVVVDRSGAVTFANGAVQELFQQPPEELLGHLVVEAVHPDERDRCRAQLAVALEQRVMPLPGEYRLRRADGSPVTVSSAFLPYDWYDEPAVLLVLQDRTALRQAEDERNAASSWLGRILQASAEGIVCLDEDSRISFMNSSAAALLGLDAEAVLGRPAHPLFHHSRGDGSPYPPEQCPCLESVRHGRMTDVQGEVFWRSDGTPLPVEYRTTPLAAGQGTGAVMTFHDVTERVRARERLARLASFQNSVLDSLPSLTAVVDRTGTIIATNRAWDQHMSARGGTPQTCGVGVDVLAVCDRADGSATAVAAGLRRLLAGEGEEFQLDVPCQAPDGSVVHFALQIVPLHTEHGGAVISYTDITQRKLLEVDAAHRATHDELTGLPNRTLLLERLHHALEVRGDPVVAVLFLDLDAFKLVNDSYGHAAGDAVLRELADRLRHHVRPSDTVARLAGDEFVVLCEGLPHATEAYLLADRLIAAIAEPFGLRDTTITLGASIGIAVAGQGVHDADGLLRAADQAMFDAKARGRNRFAVFDAHVRDRHSERLEQAMRLRRLVEDDDLLVHYQPVIDLRDGHVTGSEALLRWHGDLVIPDTATAITLAEEMGLIGRIGTFVLEEATRQAATFLDRAGAVLPLSVNLAPQQLDRGLVDLVQRSADAAGYPITSMTLELTERSVMSDPAVAIDVLRALRGLGVTIALDDFGVGYSSLAALRDLPLDVIKIDRAFVQALMGSDSDDRLVRAIIEMARALDLSVVAEGIEEPEQRDRLLELGCVAGQGFLYSPARSAVSLRRRALR